MIVHIAHKNRICDVGSFVRDCFLSCRDEDSRRRLFLHISHNRPRWIQYMLRYSEEELYISILRIWKYFGVKFQLEYDERYYKHVGAPLRIALSLKYTKAVEYLLENDMSGNWDRIHELVPIVRQSIFRFLMTSYS